MALPNPNINDIVATTIELRSKDIADNVTQQNALFRYLSEAGNIESASGGSEIRETLSYQENSNAGSYSGYDQLPTGATDGITAAQFQYAQYAVPVTFSGLEMLKNSGPSAMIDLVKARVKIAESTMSNMLNRHLYLDGTGNNGKNLTGLAAAVPLSPTNVYGNIDRSQTSNAFWKNQKWQASVDGGGVATASTLLSQWNSLMLLLTRQGDKPSVIIAGQTIYQLLESALQANQRFMSADKANAGYSTIMFQNTPVEFESTVSGIAATTAYFLNTKYLKLRPHKERNMVPLEAKSSVNQDATVKTLAWAGNLTCSGAKFQGIFSNT